MKWFAGHARTIAAYVREARSPLSFWRLLRVRLAQSKLWWACPSPITVTVHTRSLGKVELRSHTTDISVFGEIVGGRQYEPAVRHATGVRTIIDLGANTGLSARWFFRHFPNARLIAVEPDSENVSVLRRNLLGYDSEILDACVGGHERSVSLMGDRADGYKMNDSRVGQVPVKTMDTVLALLGHDTVDLLKIDIEGAEQELLDGCANWIRKVRLMTVECHAPYTANDLFDALRRNGAAPVPLDVGPSQFGYQMVTLRVGNAESPRSDSEPVADSWLDPSSV